MVFINISCDVYGDYFLNEEFKVNGLYYDLFV